LKEVVNRKVAKVQGENSLPQSFSQVSQYFQRRNDPSKAQRSFGGSQRTRNNTWAGASRCKRSSMMLRPSLLRNRSGQAGNATVAMNE